MSGDDLMLFISRWVGVAGLGLLILSGVGGTLLASRIAQKLRFLRGKTFKYHRLGSIVGATLVALHPVPLLWTENRTGSTGQTRSSPSSPRRTMSGWDRGSLPGTP